MLNFRSRDTDTKRLVIIVILFPLRTHRELETEVAIAVMEKKIESSKFKKLYVGKQKFFS